LQESFEKAQKWVDELKRSGGVRMVLAMAGNKLDLAEQRLVPQEKALAYAEENGIFFIETSAKTSQNVRGIVLFLSFPFLSFHDKRMHFRETRAVEP
jgi:Ras-related protein Rab-5C